MTVRWLSALFTLSLLVLVAWAVWQAWSWVPGKGLAPRAIGIPTALLLGAVLVQQLRGKASAGTQRQEATPAGDQEQSILGAALVEEAGPALDSPEERRQTAHTIVWIVGFALAIWLLGFQVGIPLLTLLYLKLAGREGWLLTVILVVSLWASIALFFDCTIHIYFIPGQLFVWLGLEPRQFEAEVCRSLAALLP